MKKIILCLLLIFSFITLYPKANVVHDQYQDFGYTIDYKNEIVIQEYYGNDSTVEIPAMIDGKKVVSIASEAFNNNYFLEVLIISENIEYIAHDAVFECESFIKYEVYPNNSNYASVNGFLTNKNKNTLIKCPTGLKKVVIPNTFTKMNEYAFAYNNHLNEVVINHQMVEIASSAFLDCVNLTSIHIPSNIKVIKEYAFDGCINLKQVSFDEGIEVISQYAFNKCGLTTIDFVDSLHTIDSYAFNDCIHLNKLYISENIETINASAFAGCINLVNIVVDSKNMNYTSINNCLFSKGLEVLYLVGSEVETFTFPSKTYAIDNYAFSINTLITDISIPSNIFYIGTSAFENCVIEEIILSDNITYIGTRAFANSAVKKVVLPSQLDSISISLFEDCYQLKEVIMPDQVELIEERAFLNCVNLKSIDLADSIKSINDFAFYNCNSLSTINLPSTLENIGTDCFSGTKITDIYIPNSVLYIGLQSFYGCENLLMINVASDNLNYSSVNGHLYDKKQETLYCMPSATYSFKLLETTKIIAPYACSQVNKMTTITLTNKIEEIQESAFSDCPNLININLSNSLREIHANAFSGCNQLSSINIPQSIIIIDSSCFDDCDALTRIEVDILNSYYASEDGILYSKDYSILYKVPKAKTRVSMNEQVKTIASRAFYNCDLLEEVILGKQVEVVKDQAFDDCSKLKKVVFNDFVDTISYGCFNQCTMLTEVVLPTNLKVIEEYAFNHCESLTNISLPSSLNKIYDYAFTNCTSLTKLYIPCNVTYIATSFVDECTSLTQLQVDKANMIYQSYDNSLYCNQYTRLVRAPLNIDQIKLHQHCVSLSSYCFDGSNITSIKLIEGIEMIPAYCFVNCIQLKELILPYSLQLIDPSAYSYCNNIKNIYYYGEKNDFVKVLGYDNDAFQQAKIYYLGKYNADSEYQDIFKNDWYYQMVSKASEQKLMGALKTIGDAKYFGPNEPLSRGMVATILYRLANETNTSFKVIFKDVTNGSLWYANAITWASEKQIVKGYQNGNFGPDDQITRQDLAIMLRNYANYKGIKTKVNRDLTIFNDVNQISDYACSALAFCVDKQILSGSKQEDKLYLLPTQHATRAQAAKMFMMLKQLN